MKRWNGSNGSQRCKGILIKLWFICCNVRKPLPISTHPTDAPHVRWYVQLVLVPSKTTIQCFYKETEYVEWSQCTKPCGVRTISRFKLQKTAFIKYFNTAFSFGLCAWQMYDTVLITLWGHQKLITGTFLLHEFWTQATLPLGVILWLYARSFLMSFIKPTKMCTFAGGFIWFVPYCNIGQLGAGIVEVGPATEC